MESLETFMRKTYTIKPDNRITVKEIYEDFRTWILVKFGISVWNNITQRQVYAALKELPNHTYVRYREGFCLKGIAYKEDNKATTDNSPLTIRQQVIATGDPIDVSSYLTLNIVPIPQPLHVEQIKVPVENIPIKVSSYGKNSIETDIVGCNPIVNNLNIHNPVNLNISPINLIGTGKKHPDFHVHNNTRTVPRAPQTIMPKVSQMNNS